MTAPASTAVLYCQGTFDIAHPTSEQMDAMIEAAQTINTSGFTTVILGQWHVSDTGQVSYNDTPFEEVLNGLQVLITAIKMGGGSVQKVLITFGPFGTDFDHIAANLDAVKSCISTLQAMADLDGIDFDLEQEYTQAQADTLVTLTNWATGKGMIVTAAPYDNGETGFWSGVLKRVGGAAKPGFAWWNLQLYGGADYSIWESAINGEVSNPDQFLVPGWNAAYTSPADLASQLGDLKKGHPNIDGGFIWKFESAEENGHTVNEYAAAITGVVG